MLMSHYHHVQRRVAIVSLLVHESMSCFGAACSLGVKVSCGTHKADYYHKQVFNYLLGSLARVFTTLQEVDDKLILYSFVAGFALNLVLALQMLYYWNQPSAKALGKRKEKIPQPIAGSSSASTTGSSTASVTPKKAPTTRRRG